MSERRNDRNERLFVEGFGKFFSLNPESLTPDEIKNMNNMSYPRGVKNRYLAHTRKPLSVTSYIIPVSDGGSITAYYVLDRNLLEKGPLPLVIFFHGGGWLHANMDLYLTYVKYFAYKMESAVLLVDYRLGQNYRFPTAVEDCYDAVLWASEGVKYWKVDPDQVYLAGDGFGATLAISATMLLRDRKGPAPQGNLLFYPLTDGRLRTQSMETYRDTPVLTQRMLSWYIKNYSRETKDSLSPLMSPLLSNDLTRMPPTLTIAAGIDPLLDDSVLYTDALQTEGGKAKVLICRDSMHGFMLFRHAKERPNAESAVWQMLHGRNVEAIELLSPSEFRDLRKKL